MTTRARHTSLILVSFASLGLAGLLHAQSLSSPIHPGNSPATPPPPPKLVSPVEQFRELLALSASERENHLTNRPPVIRQRILAKLREYDAMNPDERDLRLRNTQLRWYLLCFMESPPGQRATQISMVPDADRAFVKDHLEQWDRLPADEQKEILKYEKVIENLLAQGFTNAASTTNVIAAVPTAAHPESLKNLDTFLKLPETQRQQMYSSFERFFELNDEERQKTLGLLTSAERLQMNAALRSFAQLPKEKREHCLNSFNKFSSMSEAERQEFLKNAERWREMSPAERQAWRNLVMRLRAHPPLPPGMITSPPLPPMPPMRTTLQVSLPVPTNSTQ